MSDNETKLRSLAPSAAAPPATGAETRLRMPSVPLPSAPLAHTDEGMGAADGPETQFRPSSPPPAAESPTLPAIDATASVWREQDAQRPSEEVSSGRVLGGRYLLERKLGEGGMGVVYFASDQEVKGETFAIKVLKPEIREYPEALGLLREEVRKTRSLSHPNIVGVYSLNTDSGCIYMLMEYLEGKPLDALLDEDFGRGMPFERAWLLIQDICTALAFAHDRSVIHSDLKPANVFVTTGGRAKLLDFGIARAARGRPRGADPAALGALTPAYASCEMLEEGHEPDARDDIYALACVIYELLSGKHPFGGRTAVEAREEKRRPAPLASLSRAQNAALARALAFDREQRTASVEALAAGLAATSGGKRRPGVLFLVGVIVVVLAAGVGWWALSSSRRQHPGAPSASTSASAPVDAGVISALGLVRGLADQARKLEIDSVDPSLVRGTQLLRAAEQQVATGDGTNAARSLASAQNALSTALRSGARVAHVGSGTDEVQLAVNLCKQAGGQCSPADFADEAPRDVVLRPFELDPTSVTNGDFAKFAQTQGYQTLAEQGRGVYEVVGSKLVARPRENWKTFRYRAAQTGIDPAGFPVRGIDFESAKAYCAWAGKRLPTEEEWEYMARPDHRIFPWGNEVARPDTQPARLLPVAEQSPTGRFGVRGLGGTLWEWVDGGTVTERVFRGASWLETNPMHERLATRGLEDPARAHVDTGFRCARSVDAWPTAGASLTAQ